jgi:hypothetical protein
MSAMNSPAELEELAALRWRRARGDDTGAESAAFGRALAGFRPRSAFRVGEATSMILIAEAVSR